MSSICRNLGTRLGQYLSGCGQPSRRPHPHRRLALEVELLEDRSMPAGLALDWSTFLGGAIAAPAAPGQQGHEQIRDIATDSQGNIYVTGGTSSLDFPVTPGAYDRRFNTGGTATGTAGEMDGFIAKFSPDGQLLASTFLGGPNYDRFYAIEVDNQGYVYVAGVAGIGFPTTANAFLPNFYAPYSTTGYGTISSAVAKLTPDLSQVVYASYLPGAVGVRDMAVNPNTGEVFLGANVDAASPFQLPSSWLTNAYQSTVNGTWDAAVIKVSADGTQATATYFGGSGIDGGLTSIRVDASGRPYLRGMTASSDMPVTANAYDTTFNGPAGPTTTADCFVAAFSADLSALVAATYFGGSKAEYSETHGLALDARGNVIIAASTYSSDLPTTVGAYDRTYNNIVDPVGQGQGLNTNYAGDGFVAKLSGDLTRLLASTYIGGEYGEGIEGVGVDNLGNVYVSGATFSNSFPVTGDAVQSTRAGDADAFLVKFNARLTQLEYSTYLGGTLEDFGRTAHVDGNGTVYIGGETKSLNWPTTANAAYPTYRGGPQDAMLAKFIPVTPMPLSAPSTGTGASSAFQGLVYAQGGFTASYLSLGGVALDETESGGSSSATLTGAGSSRTVRDAGELEYIFSAGDTSTIRRTSPLGGMALELDPLLVLEIVLP